MFHIYHKLWDNYGSNEITVLHPDLLENPTSCRKTFDNTILGSEVLSWIQGCVVLIPTGIREKMEELGKACCQARFCTNMAKPGGLKYTPSSPSNTLEQAVTNMCVQNRMTTERKSIHAIAGGPEIKSLEKLMIKTLEKLVQKYDVPVDNLEKCTIHMTGMYSQRHDVQPLHRDFHVNKKKKAPRSK